MENYTCYTLPSFGIICTENSVCISYKIYIYAHIHVNIIHDELKIIWYKINVQWTLDSQMVCFSNNLKLKQKIRFETRIKI